ncbi:MULTISPECIES: hypothetical protein [Rhizobium]|uniref:hypothetical protein n=1 Tax=Rhizobium TaxID=379 RepID=UPI001A938B19|nr:MULTISPECIES: hypothetical protein [Rhizobium]MBX5017494.1 hypothetical protein [Rhizobium lentis]MBX5063435.1 hypothetical protein [Rhizobium lentis]MBX5075541.1 hypothetical protein [Rhizobium lentis]MBX5213018.1 hypothetical protein [Rhizobium sp. NLR9a]MBX5234119.1 hypothetical protein [Rhizobium sp. NLR4a]
MLLKMIAGLSGPEFNLAPGDEREFVDAEAERLIEAGFAVKAEADEVPAAAPARKKGKANVVSAEGDAGSE